MSSQRATQRRGRMAGLCVGMALSGLSAAALPPAAARPSRGAAAAARNTEKLRAAGEAALVKKDYGAAGPALTEFYRQTLQPNGLYLLGRLADAEGRLLDAQDLMRRFLSDAHFAAAHNAQEEAAATEVRRILALPRPPNGKVNIIGEPGVLISLDGRLVGVLPLSQPLLVAPGKHTLAITDGKRRLEEQIDVSVGHFIEVTCDTKSATLLSAQLPGILVLEEYVGLPTEAAAPLGQAVEDTLKAERLSPQPIAVMLAQAGLPRPCSETPTCQLQLAKKSELDYVLAVHLTQRAPGSPWQLQLDVLDVEVDALAAHREQECPDCTATKAVAALASSLPPLLAEARRRPRGELEVQSTPPGAGVRLAGQTLGTTPLTRPAWSGPLELEVALAGYQTQHRPLLVKPGGKATLTVTLVPEVAEPVAAPLVAAPLVLRREPARRPRWRLVVGGVALGTGALLVGFGAGALAADGVCADTPNNPRAPCRQVYSTSGLGTGLLTAGGALLVSGTVLLAVPPRQPAENTK